MKNYDDFDEMALFRFKLLAPLIHKDYPDASVQAYLERICQKSFQLPNGKMVSIKPATIRDWAVNYRKHGFQGIRDQFRSDIGKTRALDDDTKALIVAKLQSMPRISATAVYRQLIHEQVFHKKDVSLSSVTRYIKQCRETLPPIHNEVRAFEMQHANDMWQMDTTNALKLKIDGKVVQTYIIGIIDDASRLIVGAEVVLNDNAINVQNTLKSAIKKFGIPKKLYLDNGSSFSNKQFSFILAKIGIVERHHMPYDAKSKGKIERVFGTLKTKWMNQLDWRTFSSIDEVQISLDQWLYSEYNNTFHSTLGMAPRDRYTKDHAQIRRMSNDEIDHNFLNHVERKISKSATVILNDTVYETPQRYIGQKVLIRYDTKFERVYIEDKNELVPLWILNRTENTKTYRKKNIYGGTI